MTLPPPPPEAAGPLLTRADLAVLSTLADTHTFRAPIAADRLGGAWSELAPFLPPPGPKRTARLGRLANLGLTSRTDTGGPRSKARTLWRLTPAGADTLTAYAREHPRRP